MSEAIRSAPEVVAAAEKAGRILPAPVNAELPASLDPFRAWPKARPLGDDAI